jgi:hypothetical protein
VSGYSSPVKEIMLEPALARLGLAMAEVMREPRDFLIVANDAEIVENLARYTLAKIKISRTAGGSRALACKSAFR